MRIWASLARFKNWARHAFATRTGWHALAQASHGPVVVFWRREKWWADGAPKATAEKRRVGSVLCMLKVEEGMILVQDAIIDSRYWIGSSRSRFIMGMSFYTRTPSPIVRHWKWTTRYPRPILQSWERLSGNSYDWSPTYEAISATPQQNEPKIMEALLNGMVMSARIRYVQQPLLLDVNHKTEVNCASSQPFEDWRIASR
jgi:hypothetical protein